MGKKVFMFPGQGSQYIGMAQDFYLEYKEAKEVFDLASEATGLDVAKLCFEEIDKINITEYTQICMLTAELAILAVLESKGVTCDMTAGLSLGEYGALVVSGLMSMKDAFSVVRKRGIYMQNAVPTGGAMSAVLGLDPDTIKELCEKTSRDNQGGIVSVANYNCPGQIVITGEEAMVALAGEACKEAGAKRVVPLKVSGPFHSKMLTGAGAQLKEALDEIELGELKVPYITNVTADYVTEKDDVRKILEAQVSSSVCWQQSIEKMIADGADEFVEIGPGKTLSGFMRKINRDVKTVNIERVEDLKAYVG